MAEEQKKENVSKISRREFLKDAGLVVGGATIGSMAILGACSGDTKTVTETVTTTASGSNSTVTVTTPGTTVTTTVTAGADANVAVAGSLKTIKLTINNEEYEVETMPEWPLQYLLHDKLGFLSIKDMCTGYGACGTCTAVVDGKPALTCMLLAIECDGAKIETAEGIAISGHPLIDAYIKYDCMQCGYCTPGFVTTAKALLDRNPNPTKDEIEDALAGNLCRCGTYPQHASAVLEAASKLGGS
jgi:aerobic-type carbon monoxide dehydrogenase small subunit (CoxS/CutS family)